MPSRTVGAVHGLRRQRRRRHSRPHAHAASIAQVRSGCAGPSVHPPAPPRVRPAPRRRCSPCWRPSRSGNRRARARRRAAGARAPRSRARRRRARPAGAASRGPAPAARRAAACRRAADASGSATSTISICAVMTGSSASATKPPPSRTMRAAFDAAAITDGSSTAIGTSTSRPLTRKLSPTPSGSAYTPTAFSTILSAVAVSRPPPSSVSRSCAVRSATPRSAFAPLVDGEPVEPRDARPLFPVVMPVVLHGAFLTKHRAKAPARQSLY